MPPEIRTSKLFPRDIIRPTVQRDLSMYTHLAQITGVDSSKGTCSLRFISPKPGYREDVLISHGSPGDVSMPVKGDYVLFTFDPWEQVRIVSYVNLGQKKRVVDQKTLPELGEGEKFFETGGSYVWVRDSGDILLATSSEGFLLLENSSGTIKSETINSRVTTEAGVQFSGVVQRFKPDGTSVEYISRFPLGDPLTEHRIKIVETADLLLSPEGLSDPLIDICLGTYVTDDGNIVNKNNEETPTNAKKEILARISLKSGVKIYIDKEGRISLEGVKLNINKGSVDVGDEDIALGLEINHNNLGDVGQRISRTHDQVTIPIGKNNDNTDYKGLITKNTANLSVLQTLASAIISPAGPCALNPGLLPSNLQLEGEITEGASNIYLGD